LNLIIYLPEKSNIKLLENTAFILIAMKYFYAIK
jgi:hypothetical protein